MDIEMPVLRPPKEVENSSDEASDAKSDNVSKADASSDPTEEQSSLPKTLREHDSMQYLLDMIPSRAQKGFFNVEILKLTCIDATGEYIALGSSVGTIFLFHRAERQVLRLRYENYTGSLSCIKIVKAGDYFLAAGTADGTIIVFQLMLVGNAVEVLKLKISGIHTDNVTALEMSDNGENLFSGDSIGKVFHTQLDYQNQFSHPNLIIQESYGIVQLSYQSHKLVISTTHRSILHHILENRTVQIGQQERKIIGSFGALITQCSSTNENLTIYAARPNFRIWKANIEGAVEETIILKGRQFSCKIPVNSDNDSDESQVNKEGKINQQFGTLLLYKEKYLLTWNKNDLIILDLVLKQVVGECSLSSDILDICTCDDEIFILLQKRQLIRLATAPETLTTIASNRAEEVSFLQDLALPLQDIKKAVKEKRPSFSSVISSKSSESIKQTLMVPKSKIVNWVKNSWTLKQNVFTKSDDSDKSVQSNSSGDVSEMRNLQNEEEEKIPEALPAVEDMTDSVSSAGNQLDEQSVSEQDTTNLEEDYSQKSPEALLPNTSEIQKNLLDVYDDSEGGIVYKRKKKKVKKRARSKSPRPAIPSSSQLDSSGCSLDGSDNKCTTELSTTPSDSFKSSVEQDSVDHKGHRPTRKNPFNDMPMDEDHTSMFPRKKNEDDELQRILDAYNRSKQEQIIEKKTLNDENAPDSEKKNVDDTAVQKCGISLDPLNLADNNDNKNITSSSDLQKQLAVEIPRWENEIPSGNSDDLERDIDPSPYSPSIEDSTVMPSIDSGFDVDTCNLAVLKESSDLASIEQNDDLSEAYASDWIEYRAPTPVLNVSSCKNYVCWIDNKENLHYVNLKVPGLAWVQTDKKANQVAVSPSGNIVWILYKGVAYSAKNPSSDGPLANHWLETALSVKYISVDDSSAWYIGQSGDLYTQQKLSFEQPLTYPKKITCYYSLQQVSSLDNVVWALTTCGKLICTSVNSALSTSQFQCKEIACDIPISSIALGLRNTGWIVDTEGKLWFKTGVTETAPWGSRDEKWWKLTDCFCDLSKLSSFLNTTISSLNPLLETLHCMPSSSYTNKGYREDSSKSLQKSYTVLDEDYIYHSVLRQAKGPKFGIASALLGNQNASLTATDAGIWYCRPWSNILHANRRNVVGHQWRKMKLSSLGSSSKWTHVCASGVEEGKGVIWAIHCSGELICFTLEGNPLTTTLPVSSSDIVCLSSAYEALWILTVSGDVYIRKGISQQCPTGSLWVRLNLLQLGSSKLVHISCSPVVVWACDMKGRALMRHGSKPTERNLTPAWIYADGDLLDLPIYFTKVCVGPYGSMVWAIDNKKKVYAREGVLPEMPIGNKWVVVPEIEAEDIAISNNAVWVLTPLGEIYRRFGVSAENFAGDYWKKVAGKMKCITVTSSDQLWALSSEGHLYYHSAYLLKFQKYPIQSQGLLREMSCDDFEDDWVML